MAKERLEGKIDKNWIGANTRESALADRDSISYAEFCNIEGIEPEDRELYEEGMAILAMRRGSSKLPESDESLGDGKSVFDYKGFGREIEERGLGNDASIYAMRELLVKYGLSFIKQKGKGVSIMDVDELVVRQIYRGRRATFQRKYGDKNQ